MTTVAHLPTGTPRAHRIATGRSAGYAGRLCGCLRLVVLSVAGLADPAELAEAGVAAPGYRGGIRHLSRG